MQRGGVSVPRGVTGGPRRAAGVGALRAETQPESPDLPSRDPGPAPPRISGCAIGRPPISLPAPAAGESLYLRAEGRPEQPWGQAGARSAWGAERDGGSCRSPEQSPAPRESALHLPPAPSCSSCSSSRPPLLPVSPILPRAHFRPFSAMALGPFLPRRAVGAWVPLAGWDCNPERGDPGDPGVPSTPAKGVSWVPRALGPLSAFHRTARVFAAPEGFAFIQSQLSGC